MTATLDPAPTSGARALERLARDGGMIAASCWTAEYFAGEYPVVVRVAPTRWRVS